MEDIDPTRLEKPLEERLLSVAESTDRLGSRTIVPSTLELIRSLGAAGLKTGIFSSSRHAGQVLATANVLSLFDMNPEMLCDVRIHFPEVGREEIELPAARLRRSQRLRILRLVDDTQQGIQPIALLSTPQTLKFKAREDDRSCSHQIRPVAIWILLSLKYDGTRLPTGYILGAG